MQRIIRDYYEQLYGNELDKLEEMDRFLENVNTPRLNQEEVDIMNNTTISTGIEAVIKNLPKNESQGPDGFTGQIHQAFKDELMPIFLKHFQKISEKEILLNSFYESIITLTPKPDKDNTQKRKLQATVTDEYRSKNPQQNFSKKILRTH